MLCVYLRSCNRDFWTLGGSRLTRQMSIVYIHLVLVLVKYCTISTSGFIHVQVTEQQSHEVGPPANYPSIAAAGWISFTHSCVRECLVFHSAKSSIPLEEGESVTVFVYRRLYEGSCMLSSSNPSCVCDLVWPVLYTEHLTSHLEARKLRQRSALNLRQSPSVITLDLEFILYGDSQSNSIVHLHTKQMHAAACRQPKVQLPNITPDNQSTGMKSLHRCTFYQMKSLYTN